MMKKKEEEKEEQKQEKEQEHEEEQQGEQECFKALWYRTCGIALWYRTLTWSISKVFCIFQGYFSVQSIFFLFDLYCL